jgi:hypothetical protein
MKKDMKKLFQNAKDAIPLAKSLFVSGTLRQAL